MEHSKVLLLHGLNSQPFPDRMAILRASGAEVFGPHIDYHKEDCVKIAMEIIDKEKITHLVGHSLGGILSYFMSNLYKIPTLMFNPAFRYENISYFSEMKPLEKLPIFDRQYAVVGMQDDVINPDMQIANLKHATVWTEEELGHRIDPTTFKKYFEEFCKLENIT
jgi:hypothetical protein